MNFQLKIWQIIFLLCETKIVCLQEKKMLRVQFAEMDLTVMNKKELMHWKMLGYCFQTVWL